MADEFEFADKVPSSFDRRENWEGIESPGLTFLVQALGLDARLYFCFCTLQLSSVK